MIQAKYGQAGSKEWEWQGEANTASSKLTNTQTDTFTASASSMAYRSIQETSRVLLFLLCLNLLTGKSPCCSLLHTNTLSALAWIKCFFLIFFSR